MGWRSQYRHGVHGLHYKQSGGGANLIPSKKHTAAGKPPPNAPANIPARRVGVAPTLLGAASCVVSTLMMPVCAYNAGPGLTGSGFVLGKHVVWIFELLRGGLWYRKLQGPVSRRRLFVGGMEAGMEGGWAPQPS